jgi:hypothetical protein
LSLGKPWYTSRSYETLLFRLIEISQIRRRLVLFGWHQQAVGAQEIAILADDDMTRRSMILLP